MVDFNVFIDHVRQPGVLFPVVWLAVALVIATIALKPWVRE